MDEVLYFTSSKARLLKKKKKKKILFHMTNVKLIQLLNIPEQINRRNCKVLKKSYYKK